jgi:hypothetical protein
MMKRILLLGAIAACGSKGSVTRDYKLGKAEQVPVRITVPSGWAESDNNGDPRFQPNGSDTMFPNVALLVVGCPGQTKGAECITKRIAVEFQDTKYERSEKAGATWVVAPNEKNGGAMEQRLVFDGASGSLVKCFIWRSKDDDAAPLRAACDSLIVRPSPA